VAIRIPRPLDRSRPGAVHAPGSARTASKHCPETQASLAGGRGDGSRGGLGRASYSRPWLQCVDMAHRTGRMLAMELGRAARAGREEYVIQKRKGFLSSMHILIGHRPRTGRTDLYQILYLH
jgi:hypothetical protein